MRIFNDFRDFHTVSQKFFRRDNRDLMKFMTKIYHQTFLVVSFFSLIFFRTDLLYSKQSFHPSLDQLRTEIHTRITRVPEFNTIMNLAEKLGIKHVWLFGGTASAYAHYVRWDLEREKGDTKYDPNRFDYKYYSMFRSDQDLDIVVDAEPALATQLQNALQTEFRYFQGSKSVWEVRPLKKAIGTKEPLLDNPDFLNQNSDSNSTGLIEITKTMNGESAIRDLKDWNNIYDPVFLKDITQGTLHYYYDHALHIQTNRYREGLNPEIFSAVRALIKVVQYELKLPAEDKKNILHVFNKFDPEKDLVQPYTKTWLNNNAPKLVKNAINIEYSFNLLDELGARKMLLTTVLDDIVYWLNKEPLRSYPVGLGEGKTAREIFESMGIKDFVVAHETNNFSAYESITKSYSGAANVLISRQNLPNAMQNVISKKHLVTEGAAAGDGFYTKVGTTGARGTTGLTIRFQVDPNAREGKDFIFLQGVHYIIFENKNAFKVIPESLNLSLYEYFEKIANGLEFDFNDKGVTEKLKRHLISKSSLIGTEEKTRIYELVKSHLSNGANNSAALLTEWYTSPLFNDFPALIKMTIDDYFDGRADEILGDFTDQAALINFSQQLAKMSSSDEKVKIFSRVKKSYEANGPLDCKLMMKWIGSGLFKEFPSLIRSEDELILFDGIMNGLNFHLDLLDLAHLQKQVARLNEDRTSKILELLKNNYKRRWYTQDRGIGIKDEFLFYDVRLNEAVLLTWKSLALYSQTPEVLSPLELLVLKMIQETRKGAASVALLDYLGDIKEKFIHSSRFSEYSKNSQAEILSFFSSKAGENPSFFRTEGFGANRLYEFLYDLDLKTSKTVDEFISVQKISTSQISLAGYHEILIRNLDHFTSLNPKYTDFMKIPVTYFGNLDAKFAIFNRALTFTKTSAEFLDVIDKFQDLNLKYTPLVGDLIKKSVNLFSKMNPTQTQWIALVGRMPKAEADSIMQTILTTQSNVNSNCGGYLK